MILSLISYLRSLWARSLSVSPFGSVLALTTTTNLFLALLNILSGVIAARLLGPVGRGELAAIQMLPTFLAGFAILGVPDALAYFSAREPHQAGSWLTTATLLCLFLCIPFGSLAYFLLPWLLQAQSSLIINAARLYLWFLPINVLAGISSHPLRGRNDLIAWNLLRPLPNMVWVGVLLICSLFAFKTATAVAYGYLATLLIVALPTAFTAKRRIPGSFRPSIEFVAPLLKYGLPSVLSSIPNIFNLRLDQMLMAGLLESKTLGLYVVAVAWSGALSFLSQALVATILPQVASFNSPEIQAQRLGQLTRLGSLFSMIASLITASLAPVAIPLLFGQEYHNAYPSAMLLSFASGILSFNQLLSAGALSLGRPYFVFIGESIGLVATVILLYAWLQRFQLMGAAMASLLSYLVVTITLLWLIQQQTGMKVKELVFIQKADLHLIRTKMSSFLALK